MSPRQLVDTRGVVSDAAKAVTRWAVVASAVVLSAAAGGFGGLVFGGGKLTVVGVLVGVGALVVLGGCVLMARRRGTEVRFLRPDEGQGRRPPADWTWDARAARWRPPGR